MEIIIGIAYIVLIVFSLIENLKKAREGKDCCK